MPNYQEFLAPLPLDGRLWLVKYIDQFHQKERGSGTVSVNVLLQCLSITTADQISELEPDEIKSILGFRAGRDAQQEYAFARIFASSLVTISIGDVYCDGVRVAQLPAHTALLSLLPGQSDSLEFTIGQPISAPYGWQGGNYQILNAFEFSGLYHHQRDNVNLKDSRVVVLHMRTTKGVDTYVIPRTTIFKAFYACHSDIANAFLSGPWSDKLENVIMLNETSGLLQTGIDDVTGGWNVVLRRDIGRQFAGLLAVLYFDPYGRAQANAIHTQSIIDRKRKELEPWYASARIPYQALREPLKLRFKCLPLRSWYYKDEEKQNREDKKYFVTEITGTSWPSHYPVIGRHSENDSEPGKSIENVDSPPPFSRSQAVKLSDQHTVIRSDIDASEDTSKTKISGVSSDWLDGGPTYVNLLKEYSKRHAGRPVGPFSEEDGREVSTGVRNRSKKSGPRGEASAVMRQENDRLKTMLDSLLTLKDSYFLTSVSLVKPRRDGQAETRNGHQCWRFIDDASLKAGKLRPRGGWPTIYDRPRDRHTAHYRTALVLKLEFKEEFYHWIEIEARTSDTYKSVLIKAPSSGRIAAIEKALSAIALAEGRRLDERLPPAFEGDDIGFQTYEHEKEKGSPLLSESKLKDFFLKSAIRLKHVAN